MDTTLVTDLSGDLLHLLQLLVDAGDLVLEVGVSVHLLLAVGVIFILLLRVLLCLVTSEMIEIIQS